MPAERCANEHDHSPSPDEYLAWHAWAEWMHKTHVQVLCQECGRYAIWRPRTPAELEAVDA